MGATQFICPSGERIGISECLSSCPNAIRCMSKPTLSAVADSVKDRGLGSIYSVTELISGTREVFLKKTTDYSVDPNDMQFALHGTAIHSISEKHSSSFTLSEVRLSNDIYTGQIDSYGDLLGNGKKILLDYKVTSSYKVAQALGYYKVDEPTGEFYKTGTKKGQEKTRKVIKSGGVRMLLDWSLQLNAYRMLLEEHNFKVDDMYIQVYVRDYSLRIASERNIDKPIYLLKINKISNHWLRLYFKIKKRRLEEAMATGVLPAFCSKRESWNGRKCEAYCNVFEACKKAYEANVVEAA